MKLQGKRILIVGGTGSLGQALIRREAHNNQLFVTSRDEAKHWTMRNKLQKGLNVDFLVSDIRDFKRIESVIRNVQPDVIILAAALKQVDTCERSPYESVQTNLLGISNVIDAVLNLENQLDNLESVLMVSTDKACAPTNVYGMSKAISERIVTSANSRFGRIKFIGVRYGNVLESRGSIIPLYRMQAENASVLSVTHEDMTRFIMTLDESIDLIEDTIISAHTGEIWIPKLRSMRILDLAGIFANRYKVGIKITGIRPGEKMHEELISQTESIRVLDGGKYLRMKSVLKELQITGPTFNYSSSDYLIDQSELESYLSDLRIFDKSMSSFLGREIDEISAPKVTQ
jgi:UDP-glucose 4-epimerase